MRHRLANFILFSILFLVSNTFWGQTLSSKLPILLVETNGQVIDFQKLNASLKVIDNPNGQPNLSTDAPVYEGLISIRLRGNYSSGLPQKPYAIETLDAATGLDTSVALLGMAKEEDWVLLANWNDKSLVRNTLMFELARRMGQWAPHTRHVELLLNGDYQGIYVFCEKIKRDGKRVDVKKLTPADNALPDISGGYIFQHDHGWEFFTGNWHPLNCPERELNFEIVYPKPTDITIPQFNYITGYVNNMEKALFSPDFEDPNTGYRAYLDIPSWVDYFLLSEFSGNVDAYKKSMYFHKDREGLLKMGPIWDFDWAMKFLHERSFLNGAGWLYTVDPCTQDVLYVPYFLRLMKDAYFREMVCERWADLRATQLDTTQIFQYIDSTALVLDDAKTRHFERWQCLGYNSGASEFPPFPDTYAGEIEKLKKFIRLRLAWMDTNLETVACAEQATSDPEPWLKIELLPNISSREFTARVSGFPTRSFTATVYDCVGRICLNTSLSQGDNSLMMDHLPSGMYFMKVEGMKFQQVFRMVVLH